MHLLEPGLRLVQYRAVGEIHFFLETLDFAQKIAGFNLGVLEPPGALARILARLLEGRVSQVYRFQDLRGAGLDFVVVAVVVRLPCRLVRFLGVLQGCAERTPTRKSTWINTEIIRLYTALHAMGAAHSLECWLDEGSAPTLAGGLYGVALGGAFFGESMFSRVTDASKVALVHLVARLRRGGFTLLDTQFVTAHLARFGALEISRRIYRKRLDAALESDARFPRELDADGQAILDAMVEA